MLIFSWSNQETLFARDSFITQDSIPNKNKIEHKEADVELDGLFTDQTRSKVGRDFYRLLYTYWQTPQGASNFHVIVQELPAISRGAQVNIKINGRDVYRSFVQSRNDIITNAVRDAIGYMTDYLAEKRHLVDGFDEAELNGIDEF